MAAHNPTATSVLQLGPGETGIFGYGSLLCRASMELTLGRPYVPQIVEASLKGWHRTWDIAMPNKTFYYRDGEEKIYPDRILYLNIRPCATSVLNGVIISVNRKELASMDAREWIYDRIPVTSLLEPSIVDGGQVFAYVGKPDYLLTNAVSPAVAAVRTTYVALVEKGLSERSPGFRRGFELSTEAPPEHLLIDDLKDERSTRQ